MAYDVVVIGGGPVGLAAGVFCAHRRLSTLVLEAEKLGGQLSHVYPSKSVYDYPGYLAIEASELGALFVEHARESGCELREQEEVTDLRRKGDRLEVVTPKGRYATRAVIVALGMGTFEPRRLDIPGELELEGRGVHYRVLDRQAFQGRRVVVVGGGDSALENALSLVAVAQQVTLVHRRDEFRAMEKTVEAVRRAPIEVLTDTEVVRILGEGRVEGCVLFHNRSGDEAVREVDDVVIQIGLHPRIQLLRDWGLEVGDGTVRVGADMRTSLEGVYACGDVVTHPGKDLRITTGIGEAAIAAMGVYQYLRRPYWA